MMIDTQTLTPIGILAVHFGSHDIAAVGDAVQKSSCRKFTQIGNDKRPCVDRTDQLSDGQPGSSTRTGFTPIPGSNWGPKLGPFAPISGVSLL